MCADLANTFDSSFTRLSHKDRGSCCQEVGNRTGGFGTKEQMKDALKAGSLGSILCPGSIGSGPGSYCQA
ncbi:MAG: uncharacterized protein KVP18_003873 [Porospora cf. gigantea A]|uniref:uncharacterized protein n=1 Tax=Porospora cf. gigantea A TaxID=2853593 RepID=UPI003559F4AB|nr:MAG: hypothetical protein KVP18_003873 [Porospora cf. gigantea A]